MAITGKIRAEKTGYFSLLKNSAEKAYKNPIIFLPYLFIIALALVFILLAVVPIITAVLTKSLAGLIIIPPLFVIVVLLGILFSLMITSMCFELTKNRKTSLKSAFSLAKGVYWRFLGLSIIRIILALLIFAIFVALGFLAWTFISPKIIALIIIILLILALIFLLVVYSMFWLFTEPMLFFKNRGIAETINLLMDFFRKNKKLLINTFLVILLIQIMLSILSFILGIIPLAGQIIYFLLSLFVAVVIMLFKFELYSETRD